MRKNEVFGQSGGGYNLNGGTVAKIRFGLNNGASREWAICGAEDGNLVLLSITAFDTIQYGETSKYSKSNFVNNIDTYLGKTYFSASELGKIVTFDVVT